MIDLSELWSYIKSVAGVVTALGFIVEFTPIKVHPLSYIARKLGDSFNKEIRSEMKGIKEDISKLNDKIKETEQKIDDSNLESKERYIKQLRGEILTFSNSCMHKVHHTKDEFDHIIEAHDEYENLLKSLNRTNGRVSVEYEYILDVYNKCKEEDSFL